MIYTLSGKDTIKGTGAASIGDLNQGGNGTGIANSGSLNIENGEDAIAGTGKGGNGGDEKFIFADSSFCYSTLVNGA
ncbi:MAG: hypothetical protein V7K21_02455 [Nostoc sp.]|uniref:hypothetical protein n=1 Tax=Nostoc sp. TaxID=1180 RepID=UPI002FF75875